MLDDHTNNIITEACKIGYAYALWECAQRIDESTFLWQPIQRPSPQARIAQRVAAMEQAATDAKLRRFQETGAIPWQYFGGAVDWHTGQPLGGRP